MSIDMTINDLKQGQRELVDCLNSIYLLFQIITTTKNSKN